MPRARGDAFRHQRRGGAGDRRRRSTSGDVVLVKGSRGTRTDLVVERLDGGVRLMLYHLLISLYPQVAVFNVARYITFRTAAASMTALVISLVLGPWLIRRLREFQIGQVIRQEGPRVASRQGRHADDGRPADPGGGAGADAAVGRPDQRLRLDRGARRRRRSAASASSTTT